MSDLTVAVLLAIVNGLVVFGAAKLLEERIERRLEYFRASIHRDAFEHETRFIKLHEKRAEAIAELYKRLARLRRILDDIAWIMEIKLSEKIVIDPVIATSPPNPTQYLTEFLAYADEIKIYFPHDIWEKIEGMRKDSMILFGMLAASYPADFSEIDDKEEVMKLLKELRGVIWSLGQDIERYFATLLGVESEHFEGNSKY